MRLVLDTNVLVAALIAGHNQSPPVLLYDAWELNLFELFTSNYQIEELTRVLAYPKLERFITPNQARRLLVNLSARAVVLASTPHVALSPDPNDNPILAIALAANADYLVSGDKRHILELKKIENTHIITARAMLDILHFPTQ